MRALFPGSACKQYASYSPTADRLFAKAGWLSPAPGAPSFLWGLLTTWSIVADDLSQSCVDLFFQTHRRLVVTATQPQALTRLGLGLAYASRIRLQLFYQNQHRGFPPVEATRGTKTQRVAWPSGLRRWIKAPVFSGAWVRIPPLPRQAIGSLLWLLCLSEELSLAALDGFCEESPRPDFRRVEGQKKKRG